MLSLQPQADNLKQLAHIFVLYLLSGSYVAADVGKLPPLEDIQQLSRTSKQNRIPILLMVSQYHCGYCDRMKEEAHWITCCQNCVLLSVVEQQNWSFKLLLQCR
ncbi:MAG: hypothetical protein AB2825_14840, partial [Candidatus Thiodiazotropha endolucinida]